MVWTSNEAVIALAVVVALVFFYLRILRKVLWPDDNGRIRIGPRPPQWEKQSYELLVEQPGEGAVRRAFDVPRDVPLVTAFVDRENRITVTTIYENFMRAMKLFRNERCLGTRSFEKNGERGPYQWKTYAQIEELIYRFGSGLKNLGAARGEHIGIYSKNREEWMVADQACAAYSLVIVALYDTLGENAVAFITRHASIRFVICSRESFPQLLNAAPECPELKTIILLEEPTTEEHKDAQKKGLNLISYGQVVADGEARPVPVDPPSPEDLYSIMYTSGTTGDPKGVLLTHANVIACTAAVNIKVPPEVATSKDAYLSFLPLAHIFERVIVQCAFSRGTRIGFYQGQVPKVIDDVQELKPSFFVAVPRVFDKIYGKVVNVLPQQGKLQYWLFQKALAAMERTLQTGVESWLWNFLVLIKARQRLGGNVRAMISGGAPLNPSIHKTLSCLFGCPIVQGYGLTETCAGATAGYLEDNTFGHVGAPMPCCEIKLVPVEDMPEYDPTAPIPTGEVAIRGPNVSPGYYKDKERTAESFRGGWFFTGDIGRWNKDGTLSIIDRKKNIFKLSHGEYIAVEKIEGILCKSKYVAQIWVYGESTRASLVAVVHPDPDAMQPWARGVGIDPNIGLDAMYADPRAVKTVLEDLRQIGRAAHLRGFELVERVYLSSEEFTPANELVTPTFKLRRNALKHHFMDQIVAMYADIPDTL